MLQLLSNPLDPGDITLLSWKNLEEARGMGIGHGKICPRTIYHHVKFSVNPGWQDNSPWVHKDLGGWLDSCSIKEGALTLFHWQTWVVCIILESWLEECQLQGEHYCHTLDPNSAHHDWQSRVYYIKLNTKIYKHDTNNTMLLIVITQSCRLYRLYGKWYKSKYSLRRKRDNSIAKVRQGVLTLPTSQGYKPHTWESWHSSKPVAWILGKCGQQGTWIQLVNKSNVHTHANNNIYEYKYKKTIKGLYSSVLAIYWELFMYCISPQCL